MNAPRRQRHGLMKAWMAMVVMLPVLLLLLAAATAQTDQTDRTDQADRGEFHRRFAEANRAYEQGDFATAAERYTQLLAAFPGNATLEYNLGNCHARLNDVGRAVLHYERALRSNPRLDDARTNLLQLAPPVNHPPVSPLLVPFAWIAGRLNVNQWLVLVLGILLAASAVAAAWALEPRARPLWKILTLATATLWILAMGFALSRVWEDMRRPAIVITPKVIARSGPGENYLESMELPAGTKVYPGGHSQQGWLRIRTVDGRGAFVPVRDLEWLAGR